MEQLPRKYKFLKIISLIFGIGLLVVNGMTLLGKVLGLVFGSSLTQFDLMYSSYIIGFIPAIFFLKASKIRSIERTDDMLKKLKFACFGLFLMMLFPISLLVSPVFGMSHDPFNYMAYVIEVFQLLLFPIFFLIFKKKLPETNQDSGLLDD